MASAEDLPNFEGDIERALQLGAPVAAALVVFAHLFFIGADLGFPEADFGQLLRYRLAVSVLFMLLCGLCLTRWGKKYRNIRILSMVIVCLCAVSVSNLTTMTGGSKSPYWTMIILTYFGGTLLLRLSVLEAGIAYLAAYLYHIANMLFIAGDKVHSSEFFTNAFGVVLALFVSLTGNWYIRRLMQSEYETRKALAEANEKLQHSITELQYKRQQEQLRYLQNRLELANDLHDSVGAKLSQINVISEKEKIEDTRQLRALAASVLENVRNFAHILKGEEQVASLARQLEGISESLKSLGRYEVSLVLPQQEIRLSEIALLNIDRILSEWTANVIRHAQASALALGAREKGGHVTIWFFQNNTPLAWRGVAERGGLKSIAMRAQNINARVRARPFKNGTLFVLRLKSQLVAA
ncbi:MAG: hypothetical protein RML34_08130 [Leptospiraceae bacterium]|nr:hypothetical protein [Leptospiraceae bacterium]